MKSKRIIVVVVSSIVLCLSLFFLFQKDTFNKLGYKAKINIHTTSYIN